MNKPNFKVNKSYINYIHVGNFFPGTEVEDLRKDIVDGQLRFDVQTQYGFEIDEFNLIFPDMHMIVGGMLGDWVNMNLDESGSFRKPHHKQILFEEFDSLNEWRLAIAIEQNVFEIYNHVTGAKDARQGYLFNYSKPDDWNLVTTVKLKQNDAIFYRPWLFHSFEGKVINHHKIYVQEE